MRFLIATLTSLAMLITGSVARADAKMDEAAIKDVFTSFSRSWNEPGMPGFEDLFTEDADFVVITGRWLKGRSEIASYHRELLKGHYRGSHSSMDSVDVRFVNSGVAIAHVASRGNYTQDGTELTRTGLATATLVKADGRWLITAFHNTLTGGPGALSSVPTWTQPLGETDRELIRLQHEWAAARVKRDVAFLESLYAKEFRITSLNGVVVERDADIAAFASGALQPESVKNEDMRVAVYGDTAVVTGLEKMKGTYNSVFGQFTVRFTNVFVRQDGRWLLLTHHSTEVRKM
jgi:uncharacterized protein (TIGR02246 family)